MFRLAETARGPRPIGVRDGPVIGGVTVTVRLLPGAPIFPLGIVRSHR